MRKLFLALVLCGIISGSLFASEPEIGMELGWIYLVDSYTMTPFAMPELGAGIKF